MINTEFVAGQRLTFETPAGEAASAPFAMLFIVHILGTPLAGLAAYSYIFGVRIPATAGMWICGAYLLSCALLLLMFLPFRMVVSHGSEDFGRIEMESRNVLGFKRRKEAEGAEFFVRLKSASFGDNLLEITYGPEPFDNFNHAVQFYYDREDLTRVASCVASAAGFRYLKPQIDAGIPGFKLTSFFEPGCSEVTSMQACLPRDPLAMDPSAFGQFSVFDESRVSKIAPVRSWQSGRLLEFAQPVPANERSIIRKMTLLATGSIAWGYVVYQYWPEARPLEHLLWGASLALAGFSALAVRVIWSFAKNGEIVKLERSTGLIRVEFLNQLRIPSHEIEYVYIDHAIRQRKTPEHRIRLFIICGARSACVATVPWIADVVEPGGALIMLALEAGRVIDRPVRAARNTIEILAAGDATPQIQATA